jgi:hypothetical protein
MTNPRVEAYRILEYTQANPIGQVDEKNCVIYGCRLLGERSKNPPPNNNIYPPATRQGAIGLIEGKTVAIDHPSRAQANETRSYRDNNGFLKGVYEDGQGLRGNWHLNPAHELTPRILWDAANAPGNLSFSINAYAGSRRPTDAGMIVESIASVDSVDCVSRGATTNNLFEQRLPPGEDVASRVARLRTYRGPSTLLREVAEAGAPCHPAGEVSFPKGGKGTDHEEAILNAAAAVLKDPQLDNDTKLKKIKKLLGLMDGGDRAASKPDDVPEDIDLDDFSGASGMHSDAMESIRRQLRRGAGLRESRTVPAQPNPAEVAARVQRLRNLR